MSPRLNARAITAAGTVLVRLKDGLPQVLLVHRSRYDDWSLPKGKLSSREYLPACATRETWEETGVIARLGIPLDKVSYQVGSGDKTVYYWRATVGKKKQFVPNDEVDKVRWLDVEKAIAKVSYPEEPRLIRQAIAAPASIPILITRNTTAVSRAVIWGGGDLSRPLNRRGQQQSRLLATLLMAYGVKRLAAASLARCIQTLTPYAQDRNLDIASWTILAEKQAERDPERVNALMTYLVTSTAASGKPLAICAAGRTLPTILAAVGLPSTPMRPGAVAVAHLSLDGQLIATEFHQSRA